jgi:hypothetical protein
VVVEELEEDEADCPHQGGATNPVQVIALVLEVRRILTKYCEMRRGELHTKKGGDWMQRSTST